jgi:hypothetical protein
MLIRSPLIFAALFCLGMAPAMADPPSLVGRISLVQGALSLHHADDTQWSPAGINYPLVAGDALWTDQGSRAEIEIAGSEARLDDRTELAIAELDGQATALRIDQGVLNLTVRFVPEGGIRLLTTVGELDIRRTGEYHVDVGRQGSAPTQLVLSVLSGEARFTGARGTAELHAGQGAMIPPDNSVLTIVAAFATPFDQWAEDRTTSLQLSQSVQYVSTEVTGFQDLDSYGRWETISEYGAVWYPTRIAVGWAPYRDGHWAFVRPWGWTWIDDAPWGFAPFHYGRWINIDGRWAWTPGLRTERHCYAPALVAFVGGAPGLTISANIGWVPLGPREVFHPYYPVSQNYLIAVNRAHVTNVTNITQVNVTNVTVNNYVNHTAVTSVTPATFTNAAPIRNNLAQQPAIGGGQKGQPVVLADLSHLAPTPAALQPSTAVARPVSAAPQPAIAAPRQTGFTPPLSHTPAASVPAAAAPAPAPVPAAVPAPAPAAAPQRMPVQMSAPPPPAAQYHPVGPAPVPAPIQPVAPPAPQYHPVAPMPAPAAPVQVQRPATPPPPVRKEPTEKEKERDKR